MKNYFVWEEDPVDAIRYAADSPGQAACTWAAVDDEGLAEDHYAIWQNNPTTLYVQREHRALEEKPGPSIQRFSIEGWEGSEGPEYSATEFGPEGLTKISVIFDGPPAHESGRFVEVEDMSGRSLKAGQWRERDDGLWSLDLLARLPDE